MRRLQYFLTVAILAAAVAACGEPDPADVLASQIQSTSESAMHEMHLRDVVVDPEPHQDGRFDALVPVAFVIAVDSQSDEIIQQNPDELRIFMYGRIVSLLRAYREAGLEDQKQLLTFHILHPDTDEVLIELDLPLVIRASLDFDVSGEEISAIVQELPGLASRYEDDFSQEHFEEVLEFFEDFLGRS